MLQNAQGLPAAPADVPASYPLRISWPGILVDDEGHREDIVGRVREAIQVIWGERAEAIEQEACEILGVRSLREYFGKPALFFADHLQRLLQEPPPGTDLLAALHTVGRLHALAVLPPPQRPDALLLRQRLRRAEAGAGERAGRCATPQDQPHTKRRKGSGAADRPRAGAPGFPHRAAADRGVLEAESQRRRADHRRAAVEAVRSQALAETSERDLGKAGGRRVRLGAPELQHLARACAGEVQDR